MTELQAYLVVQKASMEAAGEQALVYGDFVSGPRTLWLHAKVTLRTADLDSSAAYRSIVRAQ